MSVVFWTIYGIGMVALVVTAWRRIGEYDRAQDELERRRAQHR